MRLNTNKCPNAILLRWLDGMLDVHEVRKEQRRVSRHQLAPAVEEEYNVELEKILQEEGMKHPLIVLDNTFENWQEATLGLKNAVPFKPEHALLVVYGNQRLRILDKLEVEHDIPVFIANSHVEAILIFTTLQQMIDYV